MPWESDILSLAQTSPADKGASAACLNADKGGVIQCSVNSENEG
jgi:hypothetical protein